MFVFCGFLAVITVHGRGDEEEQAILGYASFAIIAIIISAVRIIGHYKDKRDNQNTKNDKNQPAG